MLLLICWLLACAEPTPSERDDLVESDVVSESEIVAETASVETAVEDTGWQCERRLTAGEPVELDETCQDLGAFPYAVEPLWQKSSFAEQFSWDIARVTPVVGRLTDDDGDGDIDSDDPPDVVLACDDGAYSSEFGVLRVLSGEDGSELATLQELTWNEQTWSVAQQAGVALGDVDDDGWPELVTTVLDEQGDAYLAAFTADGDVRWVATELSLPTSRGYPALTDLDGDGEVEVVLGRSWFSGVDGSWLATGAYGIGADFSTLAVSVPVDLDGDGSLEVVVGDAIYDSAGNAVCTNDGEDGFVGVADLDDDGGGEVVVTGRGEVRLYTATCVEITSFSVTGATRGGPPALGDLDGDGYPEIVLAIEDGLEAYDRSGRLLWGVTVAEGSGRATPSLFDFDGDGAYEVIFADEGAVRIYAGDGSVLWQDGDHDSATSLEGPVVADLDGDGDAEVVVAHAGYGSFGRQVGITVFTGDADAPLPAVRSDWNQHAFHDTHIGELGEVLGSAPFSSHNSFRAAQAKGGYPEPLPNATAVLGEVCEADCDRGELVIEVFVTNDGGSDLPSGTLVSLYQVLDGVGTLVEVQELPEEVAPGESSDSLIFTVPTELLGAGSLRVRVDDDGSLGERIEECHEDDNSITIAGPFCAG